MLSRYEYRVLFTVMQSVIMLSVVMLSVVMLSVVAPSQVLFTQAILQCEMSLSCDSDSKSFKDSYRLTNHPLSKKNKLTPITTRI
jgi:hypothetical protein